MRGLPRPTYKRLVRPRLDNQVGGDTGQAASTGSGSCTVSLPRNEEPELRESYRSPIPQRGTDERDRNTNDGLLGLQYDLDDADSDIESDHEVTVTV